ncbi:helix-turn-helix domain-containing protein [Neptunicoccus cionae]|uniref:HTH-type transcriptional regulator R00410 n=1 Tax=Neptunicoccus cionae TaxID=2035344 RepID=A0A916VP36_9RHOB|nr:helix-turn-helix transcriptional regulator [Amylibacter cionae]GGA13546.1 putative HTH-type transcriptional regulator R00410 [Amylibacter cionae]
MPHPVDVHVGTKIRLTRASRGISQQKLSEMLGISFQQLQKYERGINRISASRLWEVSQALGVQISYFFDGADGGEGQEIEEISTRTIELATQINQIPNEAVKNQIVGLIKACT